MADHDEPGMLTGGNTFDHNRYQGLNPANDHWAWGTFLDWDTLRWQSGQKPSGEVTNAQPGRPAERRRPKQR